MAEEIKTKGMGRAAVLKKYFSEGSERPVTTREMVEFKNVCSAEEWKQYSDAAAEEMKIEISK